KQRICTESVGSVDRVIAFARRKQSRNIRPLVFIYPKSAHRIMNAREYPHRNEARIVANEHLVNFENCAKLARKRFGRNMREVQKDLILSADAVAFDANLEYLSRSNIARDKVP